MEHKCKNCKNCTGRCQQQVWLNEPCPICSYPLSYTVNPKTQEKSTNKCKLCLWQQPGRNQ